MEGWNFYNHAFIPATAPHEEPDISFIESGKIWKCKEKAFFARFTTDFDCGYETPFWCCIKDDAFDIDSLKAKRRYEVNKGNKNYYTKKLFPNDIESMYTVYLESIKGYSNPSIEAKEDFAVKWLKSLSSENTLMLGAFSKDTDLLCGFAHIPMHGRYIPISSFKTMVCEEKNGVNFALAYGICEYFREKLEKKEVYLCDGYRNILHETNFQNWLIKYFGFRRAYCNLHLIYRPIFGFFIKIAFPFKKLIIRIVPKSFGAYFKAIFNMEEWSRQCKKLKKERKV